MSQPTPDLYAYILAAVALLLLASPLGYRAYQRWSRAGKRSSGEDTPTPEELEEIEKLRLSGSFELRGRSSAVSRHYTTSVEQLRVSSVGGPQSLYHPPASVDSWREQDPD